MSASSSRRSLSRASSASSAPSTPTAGRRNLRQSATATSRSTVSNPPKSCVRVLRRLRSKSKTVTWISHNDGDSSDSVDDTASSGGQLAYPSTDESPRLTVRNDDEMTPSAIIDSLSLSHSSQNGSGTNNDGTALSDIAMRSVMDDDDGSSMDDADIVAPTQQSTTDRMTIPQILELFDECEDGTAYICKTCPAKIKKQARSTSNLRRHVGSKHGKKEYLFKSQLKPEPPRGSTISGDFKKKLDEKQIKAIILDSRSFGDYSRPGMREFLATAIPGYKPLHRTTVRKRLYTRYVEHRQRLQKVLERVSDLALTTDVWKDRRHRFYMCNTGHFFDEKHNFISLTLSFRLIRGRHTANRLARYLKQEIIALNIQEKVRSITSDNAPNIVSAIKQLGIGIHQSCMAHNIHLIVKSVFFPKEKKKSSSSAASEIGQQLTTDGASTEEDTSESEYLSSEEELVGTDNDDEEETRTNSSESSSSESDESTSSTDEETDTNNTTASTVDDKVLLQARLLIKQARKLVSLVHHSGPLSEYVAEQAKLKELPGEGLVIDCHIRWNSLFLMLKRFIDYREIIEKITILHRSSISGLSPEMISRLSGLLFTDDNWNYLTAICNVLDTFNQACRLVSTQRYPTSSFGYIVTCGLHCSLLKPSSGPFAAIEDKLKQYLFAGFKEHFDSKLSSDQKQGLVMAAYLDPRTFQRMTTNDKTYAEELILSKLTSQFRTAVNENTPLVDSSQLQSNDPIGQFLDRCGISSNTSSTTVRSIRERSPKEEIAFYADQVRKHKSLQEFWNIYQQDLPLMAALVRSYSIRPVSSVPSEALFSKAGYLHQRHRSSISSDTLRFSMVLRDCDILASLV